MDKLRSESIVTSLKQIALLSSSPSIKSRLTRLPPSFSCRFPEYRQGKDPPSWDPTSSVGPQVGCALGVYFLIAGPLPTSREVRRVVGDKSASLTPLPSAWVPRNFTIPDTASASSLEPLSPPARSSVQPSHTPVECGLIVLVSSCPGQQQRKGSRRRIFSKFPIFLVQSLVLPNGTRVFSTSDVDSSSPPLRFFRYGPSLAPGSYNNLPLRCVILNRLRFVHSDPARS
jgi:hypothetical protein